LSGTVIGAGCDRLMNLSLIWMGAPWSNVPLAAAAGGAARGGRGDGGGHRHRQGAGAGSTAEAAACWS